MKLSQNTKQKIKNIMEQKYITLILQKIKSDILGVWSIFDHEQHVWPPNEQYQRVNPPKPQTIIKPIWCHIA